MAAVFTGECGARSGRRGGRHGLSSDWLYRMMIPVVLLRAMGQHRYHKGSFVRSNTAALQLFCVLVANNSLAMHSSEDETLSRALDAIASLPDEVLQRQQGRILAVLIRAKNNCDDITELVNRVMKNTQKLARFFEKPVSGALACCADYRKDDTRLLDIRLCSPKRAEDRFRKGLGERSLAVQFNEWEAGKYNYSRLTDIYCNLQLGDGTSESRAPEFARTFSLPDDNVVLSAIRRGTKLLLFERLTGEVCYTPILIFNSHRFHRIRYSDLSRLRKSFISSKELTSLAQSSAGWFRQCCRKYEGKACSTILVRGDLIFF